MNNQLCKYKDILGKPRENIRQLRLFDISIIDVLLTIILGLLFSRALNLTKFNGIILAFLLSIIFHKIFCVETTINKFIGNI